MTINKKQREKSYIKKVKELKIVRWKKRDSNMRPMLL
jgi:hypothetical protein